MYRIEDILEVSKIQRQGFDNFTKVHTDTKGNATVTEYEILTEKNIPTSFKIASQLGYIARNEVKKEENSDIPEASTLGTLLSPPSDRYTTIVSEEGQDVADQISNLATKQFIQQFYETYMVPVGQMDVYNRLGTISGVIEDIHMLYPKGLPGLIGSDLRGSWRTNLNYEFKVNEGVKNSKGDDIQYKYSSLSFPPFISHEVADAADFGLDAEEGNQAHGEFDMENILYKRNVGTYRFPAFKQVNDNIRILQYFLNRCFGIESTYLSEWDLSMYMQEGLCSFTEYKSDDGKETLRVPEYVTTLTYGLLEDAPIEELKTQAENSASSVSFDISKITPFASINMAVSSRYGIDNEPQGSQCNEQMYNINQFPLSTYWYPFDDGVNDDDMNLPRYIKRMLGFEDNGLVYANSIPDGVDGPKPMSEGLNPSNRNYTGKLFYGGDLANSKKSFLYILNYFDCRKALMSGWLGVDETGKQLLRDSDTTNHNYKSNAFSYLPYWRLFYSSEGDGMDDLDLYHQEIIASGQETSIISAAQKILDIKAGDNEKFQEYCESKRKENLEKKYPSTRFDDDIPFNMTLPNNPGEDNYSDMSFKIAGCKLKIPGSKLLNMFLNKNKSAKKAQGMAGSVSIAGTLDGKSKSPTGILANAKPTVKGEKKTIYVDGVPQDVEEYYPDNDDDFSDKKTVGDGLIESSPFLFGGPHGKYFSPLTVEGYTQALNENLTTIPTMDVWSMFYGGIYNNLRGFEFTKNFKNSGSYIDLVTAVTPNEREAVCNASQQFGVKFKSNTEVKVVYKSNYFYPKYIASSNEYISNWGIFKIPDFRYYKTFKRRVSNSWRNRFSFWDWDWVFWARRYWQANYSATRMETRMEDDVPFQPDDDQINFKLIPVIDEFAQGYASSDSEIRTHIKHDDEKYKNPEYYKEKEEFSACVKYLVTPHGPYTICGQATLNYGSKLPYRHYSSYFVKGSEWNTKLEKLYKSGYRNIWCTLPITGKTGQNEILSLVCGIATIESHYTLGYGWVLTPEYRWHHRRRRHWCHHHCSRWRETYYVWKWRLGYFPTYELYFHPNKIKYNLPGIELLNKEFKGSDAYRNKDSSNIIERYNLDTRTHFENIALGNNAPELFPFATSFMEKYGEKTTIASPGYTNRHGERVYKNMPILYTKGFFFGNIAESFATEGYVKQVVEVAPYIKNYLGKASFTDVVLQGGAGMSTEDVVYSLDNRTIDIRYFATYPLWKISQTKRNDELTAFFNNIFKGKAIQVYQDNSGTHRVWYDPIDHFDVFLDTITQQIAWLEEFNEYAKSYLRDYLIRELYKKSIDKHTQEIIEKAYNQETYNSGWTDSYTEDVCYDDALFIARSVFFQTMDTEKNTISEKLEQRIKYFKSIKVAVQNLRDNFSNTPKESTIKFMILVSNMYAILQMATTNGVNAVTTLFDENGDYNLNASVFEVNESSTYDVLNNPAAIVWAYINVLYQVRKYWANLRFNKRNGSYWFLRSLERVLVYIKADSKASDTSQTVNKNIPTGASPTLKKKKIHFVQARESFTERINSEASDVSMTNAVYIKVDYLNNLNPTSSNKYNSETGLYDGYEIVYVDEVYKWAYKPKDGLYYVMSKEILQRIKSFSEEMKAVYTQINLKVYVPTEDDILALKVLGEDFSDFEIDGEKDLEAYLTECKKEDSKTSTSNKTERFVKFQNTLAKYKVDFYDKKIKDLLFPVYIRWAVAHVWTGIDEKDAKGNWHIDENQKKITTGVTRTVTDPYNNVIEKTNPISAGITFNVSASINPEILTGNPEMLKQSSLLEILCSSVNTMDLWRIEIPEQEDIPTYLLNNDPVLVPAYQMDATLQPFTAARPIPNIQSVLAGVNNTLLPIQEASLDMMTLGSMAALGELKDISQAGIHLPGEGPKD